MQSTLQLTRTETPDTAPPPPLNGHARPTASWQPWPAAGRPATAVEERRFIERLADLAVESAPRDTISSSWNHTRRDVTAVVNALRCGLDADELLRRAPGLVPGRLVAAHRDVEARRRRAARAWQAIAAAPTVLSLDHHAPVAATLLPVVVARLQERARHGDAELANGVRQAVVEVDRVGRIARSVEEWMFASPIGDAPRVGRLLYDLDEPALWDHEHFVPNRVGAVVPTRLAALLGERTVLAPTR